MTGRNGVTTSDEGRLAAQCPVGVVSDLAGCLDGDKAAPSKAMGPTVRIGGYAMAAVGVESEMDETLSVLMAQQSLVSLVDHAVLPLTVRCPDDAWRLGRHHERGAFMIRVTKLPEMPAASAT